jgi:phosphonate transport system substrate-binding protein
MKHTFPTFVTVALLAVLAFLGWSGPWSGDASAAQVDDGKKKPTPLALTFGVYRTDKATTMYRQFLPIVETIQDDLAQELGRPVEIELKIYKSYDDGLDSLVEGTADFVRFGPAPYVLAKQRNPGIELLAMEHENGEKRFKGVVVVRKDDPATTLSQLRGRRFAFGDENSTIGRYLIQAELVRAGIRARDLKSYKFLGRHDAVATAVLMGDFDAGSIMEATFEAMNEDKRLRAVHTFENVTKPWVARAGLDVGIRQALTKVLIGFDDKELLETLKITGLTTTSDEEYAFVREGMRLADQEFVEKRAQ